MLIMKLKRGLENALRNGIGELEMINNLLPCPFCGGSDIRLFYDEETHWHICNDCEATGPTNTKYSGEEDEEFINWNTRKEPKP